MKKLINLIRIALLLTISSNALAEDLWQVYQDALCNDPTFQNARATRLATNEALPQGIAGVLPNLSVYTESLGNSQNTKVNGTTTSNHYNAHVYALNLTQPLFNFANWITIVQANATVKQANATYASAALSLMVRTATAYFNVLQAEDNLRFIESYKASTEQQLHQAKQRYEVGVDAITAVYNAQASYDSTVAQEIAAKNTIQNNMEALRQITGHYYDHLAGLCGPVRLITPDPNNVDTWVSSGIKHNYDLLAARYAADAAKANIKINAAGHLPTVDAVGTVQQQKNFAPGIGDINFTNENIGIQVNVPIYTGGLTLSKTRQADYNYQASTANMCGTYRNVVSQIHQQFNNVISGISKIKADKQAVLSNASSLSSTEESYKVGTRTIVDVLLAEQSLFQAQEIYAQDQYNYIISTLTLRQYAGILTECDIMQINNWLCENRKGGATIADDAYVGEVLNQVNKDLANPPKLYKGNTSIRKHLVPQT